jgi:hypothetical protein
MTPHPPLRPDLAAACLFLNRPRHREPEPKPQPTGVLADLARLRSYN